MKKLFLVGNWKSNKTLSEAQSFVINFLNKDFISWLHTHAQSTETAKQIIICPPDILLPQLSDLFRQTAATLPLVLGAQDVSVFAEGAHTGEITAQQLAEYAKYVIIGHSERREEFGETDQIVAEKVQKARRSGLEPIVCVQGKETPVPDNVHIVAYEPLDAIGSGRPATSESAEEVAHFFKYKKHIPYVLYGGSVSPENVRSYTSQPSINGVLVGGASLSADSFSQIIKHA